MYKSIKKAIKWCFATLPRKIISTLVISSIIMSSLWFLFRPSPVEAGLPVLWLKFDEGYGTTAYDFTDNGNDFTLSAESWTTNGKFSRAWNGLGSNWVSKTDDADFDFAAADNFSISMWVKSDSATNPASNEFLIDKESSSAGYGIYFDTGGDIIFGIDDDATWTPDDTAGDIGSDYYDNTWHHVVAVKTGTTSIEIFVDGVSIDSTVVTATGTLANGDSLTIGSQDTTDDTDDFNGDIDELKIYRYSRTDTQIKMDYNQGMAVKMGGEYTLPSGLVGWWSMDEGSGSTVYDISGNANDGTINGNPVWKGAADCKFGSCLDFDGDGDYVNCGDINGDEGVPGLTVSLWFKCSSGTAPAIDENFAVRYLGTNNRLWGIGRQNDNEIGFSVYDAAQSIKRAEMWASQWAQDTSWHHIVGLYNGTNVLVYVDTVLGTKSQTAMTGNTYSGVTVPLSIGANGALSSNYFDGLIDNVMIFNRALTQEEIVEVMLGTRPAVTERTASVGATMGHWKFDEGYGTIVEDASGRGNDLTLSAESYTMSGKFGRAWDGDGAKWLSRADDPDFDFTAAEDFSITGWFKSDSATNPGSNEYLINKGPPSAAGYAVYLDTNGDVIFGVDDDATWTPDDTAGDVGNDYYDNTWHHFVAVKDGTTSITLYIDGVELSSDNSIAATGTLANSAALYLGDQDGTDNGSEFNGDLDEVKVYRFALTASDVRLEYNRGKAVRLGGEYTPPSGLVGWWKMDEGADNTCAGGVNDVCDSSANTNDGAINGNPVWKGAADCKYGSCLDFDGTGDYIDCGDINGDEGVPGLTVSLWFKCSSGTPPAADEYFAARYTGTNNRIWILRREPDNEIYFGVLNTTQSTGAGVLWASQWAQDANWHHIVGLYNGTNVLVYVDTILGTKTQGALTGNTYSGVTTPLTIGALGALSSNYFDGLIDNVMIFNRALTQEEIVEVMLGTRPAVTERTASVGATMGHWKFDEGYGTIAEDASGRGNDLTLSAESYTMSGKFGRAWNGDGAKWLSRADDPDFDFTAAEDFSLTGWFKSDSATNPGSNEYLINKGPPSAAGYAVYMDTNGDVIFGVDDDATWTPDDTAGDVGNDYYDNTWHHFVAVKDGTTSITLYIDGMELSSDTSIAATGSLANSAAIYLGSQDAVDDSDDFNGDLDEVKIYRFAMTADDVRLEYNRGKAVQLGGHRSQADTYCPPGFTGTCTPPIGEWKMDEYADNTCAGGVNDVCDSSANTNDGAINGNPVWKGAADCKFGSCLSFDGTGDYVNIGDKDIFDFGTNNFAISLWAKGNIRSTFEALVDKSDWTTANGILLYVRSSNAYTYYSIGNAVDYQFGSEDGNWHHLCVSREGTGANQLKLYYDTKLTLATDTTNLASTENLTFGTKSDGSLRYFQGLIDNVMIFNRALTAEEISWLYNRGRP